MGTSRPDDFTIFGPGSDDDEISAAAFLQEANKLKIEKLGSRITIISVIIPFVICAILLFAYMDIKERMDNVHDTGQTEVLGVAEELDTKINAMTVDLAGVKHRFETTVNSLESETARLGTTKAEKSVIKEELAQVEADFRDRASKEIKNAVKLLEDAIKKDLEALKTKESQISEALTKTAELEKDLARRTGELESVIKAIDTAIKAEQSKTGELESLIKAINTAIKDEQSKTAALETRATEQNQAITQVRKELSLVKIKADTLEQTFIDRKVLDRELKSLNQKIDQKIDEKIGQKINMTKSQPQVREGSTTPLSIPPPSPRQPKASDSISEKDLLQ